MPTIIVDAPPKGTSSAVFVPVDGELYIHFKADGTFCNNNRDCFEPYLPCNIYFKAGDAWGPAVPVQDADGVVVTYSFHPGHHKCPSCEPKGRGRIDPDDGGHTIHIGSGG